MGQLQAGEPLLGANVPHIGHELAFHHVAAIFQLVDSKLVSKVVDAPADPQLAAGPIMDALAMGDLVAQDGVLGAAGGVIALLVQPPEAHAHVRPLPLGDDPYPQ